MEEEEYIGTRHLKDFLIPLRDDDLLEENSDFYTVEIRPSLEAIVSEVFGNLLTIVFFLLECWREYC